MSISSPVSPLDNSVAGVSGGLSLAPPLDLDHRPAPVLLFLSLERSLADRLEPADRVGDLVTLLGCKCKMLYMKIC